MRLLVILVAVVSALSPQRSNADDCNLNGLEDSLESSRSVDYNQNSVPDECEVSASGFRFGTETPLQFEPVPQPNGWSVGASPSNVADLDSDGALDLWTLFPQYDAQNNSSPALMIYYNNGSGSAFNRILYRPESSYGSFGFRLSGKADDFDGDGDNDILFFWNNQFLIFRNEGGRTFSLQRTNIGDTLSAVREPYGVEFVRAQYVTNHDLALLIDGWLYTARSTGELSYTVTRINRVPGSELLYTTAPSGPPMTIAYADGFVLAAYRTAPDGSLFDVPRSEAAFIRANYGFALQRLRPAASSRTGVTFGRSIPNLRAEVVVYPETDPSSESVVRVPTGVTANVNGSLQSALLDPVDLDGDGDLDLPFLGRFGSYRIYVLINDGTDHFPYWQTIFTPPGWSEPVALHDFNGDLKADLLFLGSGAKQGVILNATSSSLAAPAQPDQDADGRPDSGERAEILDFDGDLRSDRVVVRRNNGALVWYISPSSIRPANPSPDPLILGSSIDQPIAADYNGDGKVDPAVVMQLGRTLVWRTSVNGSVQDTVFGLSSDTPLTGHLDADRRADRVLLRRSRGKLVWIIQRGTQALALAWGKSSDQGFLADQDGDGIDELIIARTTRSSLSWFGLSLSGTNISRDFGRPGDTPLPPTRDAYGALVYAVGRRSLEPWQGRIFSSSGTGFEYALGDSLYYASYSGLHDPRPGARHDLLSFIALDGTYEEPNYIARTVIESYGLVGDLTLGADGKIAARASGPGALSCDSVETVSWGSSPAWFPFGLYRNSTQPEFVLLPAARGSVSRLSLYTRSGFFLDRFKAVRRSPAYRTSRFTLAQLMAIDPVYGPIIEGRLRDGRKICWPVPHPAEATGSGF